MGGALAFNRALAIDCQCVPGRPVMLPGVSIREQSVPYAVPFVCISTIKSIDLFQPPKLFESGHRTRHRIQSSCEVFAHFAAYAIGDYVLVDRAQSATGNRLPGDLPPTGYARGNQVHWNRASRMIA